jgi:hypothetical protein
MNSVSRCTLYVRQQNSHSPGLPGPSPPQAILESKGYVANSLSATVLPLLITSLFNRTQVTNQPPPVAIKLDNDCLGLGNYHHIGHADNVSMILIEASVAFAANQVHPWRMSFGGIVRR